ncbi:glyoxalase [Winogradskyella poriferorum]|uniref:glyoxalase n=1 Tax=Winogradskyella poriferorum TaxID=307627 RepID=UPI003D651ABF
MNKRSEDLHAIRPVIASAKIYDTMSADEKFQNKTLRPIIKMQHNLFIAVFNNYIVKRKNVFYELSLQKQLDYIDNAIHKDMKFRNSIKGMIIGQFTIEEYETYILNSSALNKRMMNIVKNRLINSIQLFVKPEVLKAV